MSSKNIPTFQEVENVLTAAALKLHPSEVHGLMCGAICSHANATNTWGELLAEVDLPGHVNEVMKSLYEATVQQLNDFLFDFDLMLPDDTSVLPVRAEALTLWCQGFLTGLHEVYAQLEADGSSEVTEALHDLVEIAKMNFEEVVASEEDESAYFELVEYVRMAVILIYQAINDAEQSVAQSNDAKHLH